VQNLSYVALEKRDQILGGEVLYPVICDQTKILKKCIAQLELKIQVAKKQKI
jgi:hypothetical protein